MLAVSSTSATRPVARVRYQSGVEELITIAPGGTPAASRVTCRCLPFAYAAPPASPFHSLGRAGVVRPATGGLDGPVLPHQASGEAGVTQPRQGRLPAGNRRGAG